jgi:hypothetical protein
VWKLDYKWSNPVGAVPAAYSSETITVTLPDHSGGLAVNKIGAFTPIDGADYLGSSLVEWRISRIGGNGSDTYDADCSFIEFDFHYQIDSFGSVDEYPVGV